MKRSKALNEQTGHKNRESSTGQRQNKNLNSRETSESDG